MLVETDEGPAAGLLVELAGDRARVMYACDEEDASQSLLETWVHVDDVVEVDAPLPVWAGTAAPATCVDPAPAGTALLHRPGEHRR